MLCRFSKLWLTYLYMHLHPPKGAYIHPKTASIVHLPLGDIAYTYNQKPTYPQWDASPMALLSQAGFRCFRHRMPVKLAKIL